MSRSGVSSSRTAWGRSRWTGPKGNRQPTGCEQSWSARRAASRRQGCAWVRKVTQLRPEQGTDRVIYFTGTITDVPDTDRGSGHGSPCRSTVIRRASGRDWTDGLHRTTVYGDIISDLKRCRFEDIKLIQEDPSPG